MELRHMAVAFLINEENEALFLQKQKDAAFLPGYLVPIGGHLEQNEMSDPKQACYREIEEETGIDRGDIKELSLKYIVHRLKGLEEIRIQYVFLGTVHKGMTLKQSDEGTLNWVDLTYVDTHFVSETTSEIVHHYLADRPRSNDIYIGTMYQDTAVPVMNWSVLQDWEK